MRRPVKISSLASGAPSTRGRSCVPPIPGKIPSVVSGTPNTAVALATMKSERTASSQPPARAKPSTAAITGTGQRSTRNAACSKITCWARHASSVISLRSLRSPPAQNARSPAPVKTTARTRESRRSPSKQAPRGWHRVCGWRRGATRTERRQEHSRPPEAPPEDGREVKVGAMTVAPRGQSQAPVGRRFGDLLVSDRLVTQEQLDLALADQKRTGEKLGEILVRLRLLTEDRLIHFLSRQYGIPEVTFPEKIAPEIIKLIPDRIARKYGVVPIGRTIGSVTLALADPTNLSALDDVAFMTGLKVVPTIASPSVIRRALERYHETAPKAVADVPPAVEAESREIDFRVSVLPSIFGESVVLRLLDKRALATDLSQLGFETDALGEFQKAMQCPHGLVVITGPTGSGKTTTLYSALHTVNSKDRNIVTVEDPVEYELVGATQVQVSDEIGRTFAAALRSFLRHDPDVILVGEMRDQETAQIAVRAALTGHLVLTTLHTNSAGETISRLMDMGVPSFLLSSSLRLVVAQRLARKVCQECREPYEGDEEMLIQYGHTPLGGKPCTFYKGRGCHACHNTGMKGRIALYEVLPVTPEIRGLILGKPLAGEIQEVAAKQGMKTLREAGLLKVLEGVTTVEEVLRVTTE